MIGYDLISDWIIDKNDIFYKENEIENIILDGSYIRVKIKKEFVIENKNLFCVSILELMDWMHRSTKAELNNKQAKQIRYGN